MGLFLRDGFGCNDGCEAIDRQEGSKTCGHEDSDFLMVFIFIVSLSVPKLLLLWGSEHAGGAS